MAVRLDVTDSDSVAAAVERDGRPVDILVNNAGWDEARPFLETDEAFWDRVIDDQLQGRPAAPARVLPGMVERGWGRVVNIGSDAGRVGSSMESVYSGAKGGVIAFTKTIAREVARSRRDRERRLPRARRGRPSSTGSRARAASGSWSR